MTASSPPRGVVRFGVFEADLHAGELRKQGLKIRLQEQPFKILELLLAHRGEVVTREHLREKLWPADTFVDFDQPSPVLSHPQRPARTSCRPKVRPPTSSMQGRWVFLSDQRTAGSYPAFPSAVGTPGTEPVRPPFWAARSLRQHWSSEGTARAWVFSSGRRNGDTPILADEKQLSMCRPAAPEINPWKSVP